MRLNKLFGFLMVSILILCFSPTISFADDSIYHISGRVLDINETGIPGANVTLMSNGVVASTNSTNPAISTTDGYFSFNISQPGVYQIIAEKDYPNGSITFAKGTSPSISVSGNTYDYPVIINLLTNTPGQNTPVPIASPTITATAAQVTVTQSPTVVSTSTPTAIPRDTNVTTTPAPAPSVVNSTDVAPRDMATVTTINTPVPTPSIVFTFIPTLAVICLLAMKKRN